MHVETALAKYQLDTYRWCTVPSDCPLLSARSIASVEPNALTPTIEHAGGDKSTRNQNAPQAGVL